MGYKAERRRLVCIIRPKGISQAVYMQPTSDPNLMARTNQLMSEGAEAFSSEQYFEAFQKYHKVVQIEPSNKKPPRSKYGLVKWWLSTD